MKIDYEQLRARAKAIPGDLWTTKGEDADIEIWYGDGDELAKVHDNLGLEYYAKDIVEFWLGAPVVIQILIGEIEKLKTIHARDN